MTMQIKIKYLDETQTRISKIEQGDWIDLRAAEDVTIKKDEFKLVPLGVAMELPEGYRDEDGHAHASKERRCRKHILVSIKCKGFRENKEAPLGEFRFCRKGTGDNI